MGSRNGMSVATAKPNSFLTCSSSMMKPFVRARATVIAGNELLWHDTHARLRKTGSPLVSSRGRIFFTAAIGVDGDPVGFGHSSVNVFAPPSWRSFKVEGELTLAAS